MAPPTHSQSIQAVRIVIPYKPRPLQAALHEQLRQRRWSVVVTHRRFGKTVMAINHLLRLALEDTTGNGRYSYIAPNRVQAKAVAWDYLKNYASVVPGVRFNETELRADFPSGSRITLLGTELVDNLRGLYFDYICMDEYADHPERAFTEILRPSLSDRKGGCLFVGTPRGHGPFYKLYEAARNEPKSAGWFTKVYRASETGVLDEEELAAAKGMMSEDAYEQEFECSWSANIPGAVYGKTLSKIEAKGQICQVPYDTNYKVHTAWDLGIGDSTVIFFYQILRGGAVHIIDHYEARGEGLEHYAGVLDEKGYLYGRHYAPHDIEVRELGTGKSRREIAWNLGINFHVAPKLPLEDGIHATQTLLPRCYFDAKKCAKGLEALRHYHRVYDERKQTFRTSPNHDWSSHSADAMRMLAVSIEEERDRFKPTQVIADSSYDPFAASSQHAAGNPGIYNTH